MDTEQQQLRSINHIEGRALNLKASSHIVFIRLSPRRGRCTFHRKYLRIPGRIRLFLLLWSCYWQGTYKEWTKRDTENLLHSTSILHQSNTGSER